MKHANYHIIIIKTLPATNTKPARVKIISERFETSKIINFTNEPGTISPTLETAEMYLIGKGFQIIGHGEGKDHYYVITDTFKSPTA